MKNSVHESPRRQFLLGLACFSASAAIAPLVGCKDLSGPQPSSTPEKLTQNRLAQAFRVAIQGSFAIFVSKDNIVAYTPNVTSHRYCISDGDYTTCDLGNRGTDLAVYGIPDLSLSGVTGTTAPPVFSTTAGQDVIQSDINPVLNSTDVMRPARGTYLYAVTLPLPANVSSLCGLGKKNNVEFLVHPPLTLSQLARVHVFEYADYDPGKLAINGKPIQLPSGQTHIKILSEPVDPIATADECLHHTQKANKALADMIHVTNGISINEAYCQGISLNATAKAGKDTGGDRVTAFSRPPGCISMFVNDTGSLIVTGKRAS